MKLQYMSDLHLEFFPIEIQNAGADVLVLAGDIMPARIRNQKEIRAFWEDVSGKFPYVIYLAGNHEFYHSDWNEVHTQLAEFSESFPNIIYLNQTVTAKLGKSIFGSTLWTDCDGENPISELVISRRLNDYYQISNMDRRLSVEDTIQEHKITVAKLEDEIHHHEIPIVMTHHAPSFRSVNSAHASNEVNGAYCSNLEDLIRRNSSIAVWIHGHTHGSNDYMVGSTRVLSNARGYSRQVGRQENPDFNPNLIVKV